MPGIYVGEEDCIELQDGTKVFILRDLSQGIDDDLWAFEMSQSVPAIPGRRTFWTSKLLELAIVRIVEPDGHEFKPSLAQIRDMKTSVTDRLREEVMSRWYPLAWQEIKAALKEALEEPVEGATSGPPSTGSAASAIILQDGSSASS